MNKPARSKSPSDFGAEVPSRKRRVRATSLRFHRKRVLRRGRLGGNCFHEGDPLGHLGGMLIAQMAVGSHGQRAAVPVSQPARHGWNIYAGLNTARGEQVTQIMMGDSLHAHDFGCPVHCLLAFTNSHDGRISRVIRDGPCGGVPRGQACPVSWELPALHPPAGLSARWSDRRARRSSAV